MNRPLPPSLLVRLLVRRAAGRSAGYTFAPDVARALGLTPEAARAVSAESRRRGAEAAALPSVLGAHGAYRWVRKQPLGFDVVTLSRLVEEGPVALAVPLTGRALSLLVWLAERAPNGVVVLDAPAAERFVAPLAEALPHRIRRASPADLLRGARSGSPEAIVTFPAEFAVGRSGRVAQEIAGRPHWLPISDALLRAYGRTLLTFVPGRGTAPGPGPIRLDALAPTAGSAQVAETSEWLATRLDATLKADPSDHLDWPALDACAVATGDDRVAAILAQTRAFVDAWRRLGPPRPELQRVDDVLDRAAAASVRAVPTGVLQGPLFQPAP